MKYIEVVVIWLTTVRKCQKPIVSQLPICYDINLTAHHRPQQMFHAPFLVSKKKFEWTQKTKFENWDPNQKMTWHNAKLWRVSHLPTYPYQHQFAHDLLGTFTQTHTQEQKHHSHNYDLSLFTDTTESSELIKGVTRKDFFVCVIYSISEKSKSHVCHSRYHIMKRAMAIACNTIKWFCSAFHK